MKQHRLLRIVLESLILTLVPLATELILGAEPAFLNLKGAPYLVVGPLFTAFYGLGWGIAVSFASCVTGFVIHPALVGQLDAAFLDSLISGLKFSLPLSIFGLLGISFYKYRMDQFSLKVQRRLRKTVHSEVSWSKKAISLESVNKVLENRVSGQKDSITLLHNQVRKLASLNQNQALNTLLETVFLFTEMKSGAIWVFDQDKKLLVPVATFGWEQNEKKEIELDPDNSIEGYVQRNSKLFSVRMLLDSAEFDRFDTSRTIITMPILIKGKVWGVLNIEDLPFERYSYYTESVLAILLSLAEPYLTSITDYEKLKAIQETDGDTGLPQFPILYKTLEKELENRQFEGGFVSLIVIELVNFEELAEKWSRAELKRLLLELERNFDAQNAMKGSVFHFKNDNQLALLVPGLDKDGTSYFCLDLLTMCSGSEMKINGEHVALEIIVGFSTNGSGQVSPDSMIDMAEQLLTMQRL
jgi:predicted signal transduction protein with EAL and GGDEF domain